MRLYAISDLHLARDGARERLEAMPEHPGDWLILAGDIAERPALLDRAFEVMTDRFERVVWVPGNHELWTVRRLGMTPLRGVELYQARVDRARERGVLTPEDPWPDWPEPVDGAPVVIAPLFLLYDYSFRPDDVPLDGVRAWAAETRDVCADEFYLRPDPYPSRQAWCAARMAAAESRLSALPADTRTVLVNHWPLRRDLIHIPRAPRFTPWCGTTATEDWHRRFRAIAVVSGHLHTPRSDMIDGTRFEEVSPRRSNSSVGLEKLLRRIL